MKFEGKTFYLYVSQKEVSACRGNAERSRVLPQQALHGAGRLHPAPGGVRTGLWDRGCGLVAALGSPLLWVPCSGCQSLQTPGSVQPRGCIQGCCGYLLPPFLVNGISLGTSAAVSSTRATSMGLVKLFLDIQKGSDPEEAGGGYCGITVVMLQHLLVS